MLEVDRKSGQLRLRGKPYAGIGVNYFDAFLRHLSDARDTSFDAGFAALARRKIPFVRFMACGYWPAEWLLWRDDPTSYWKRLDAVVTSAERHGIGLIPSLFWHTPTLPDLAGEPRSAWGDATSRTHALMRRYTAELVTRYRRSPALWGWEFGNEYTLEADLPNAAEHRPPVVVERGTPAQRSERDDLSHAHLRLALTAFGQTVRRLDKKRLIASGNALPRPSAWHQEREKSWKRDTPAQLAAVLVADNPDPLDSITVHAYDDFDRVPAAAATARAARKPLFVGEFGVPGPASRESEARFAAMLGTLAREAVPLAALWVFDYSGQKEDWSVTEGGSRAYQLDGIVEANARRRAV